MFHPGDIVSYGTNGVCEITEQKRVRLAGQPCDCLILKPVYDQSMTICVPCTSQVLLDRMRPLPTKEELLAMLHEPAPAHEADADARKEQYRQALQSGDRHRLLRMVRDIHAQHQARKAHGKGLCTRRRTCCTASSRTFWASSLTPCPSSLRQNLATNKTNKEIGFLYKRCT